ncbi:MAG TPA: ferritin-like domain-containing protein [Opitutaceae bacterium]|jgi:ferritin-like metal-binding protein YciE
MSKINNLESLLIDEMRDLYNAETQLIKALPKMAEASSNDELKEAFESHLEETKGHAERLKSAFELLGESEKGKTCHAMKGLIEEGSEAIKIDAPPAVRDADIIGAAQRVEHYEMAAYGCAQAFAEKLGRDDVAKLLEANLKEEGAANKKLTEIAQTVNDDAHAVATG